MNSKLSILLIFFLLINCKSRNDNKEDQLSEKLKFQEEKNFVSTIVLKEQDFKKELISNGKLCALQKSELKFETNEMLASLYFKNGDLVKKGKLIAQLKKDKLLQAYEKAMLNLQKAQLEFQNLLIGQGYDINDSSKIPDDILEVAKIRSGYASAKSELNEVNLDIAGTELRAPFLGIIADINTKVYEKVSAGNKFCTLIDNSIFEVKFSILETEIGQVALGKVIRINPFSLPNKSYKGKITEINPVINEQGLIQVKAQVKGAPELMEGMNVKVFIESVVPNQLVVPRSAVLLRDNQEVLFKYISKDSTAYWTYVNILDENSTFYSVVANPDKNAELNRGDTIIISGNMNLAHDSRVTIQEETK